MSTKTGMAVNALKETVSDISCLSGLKHSVEIKNQNRDFQVYYN